MRKINFIQNKDVKDLDYILTTSHDDKQWWFWTKAWQSKEAEVDAELENGEFEIFDDMDDFIATLDD